jgi:WD40 repeat protein
MKRYKIRVIYIAFLFFLQLHPVSIDFGSQDSMIKVDKGASCAIRSRHGMNYIEGTFVKEAVDSANFDEQVIGNKIYFENSGLEYQGAKSLFTGAYDPLASSQTLILTATDVRLNHDVTLAGPVGLHGVINGDGHNIFLDDDLTIPEGTILHITGSSVAIDGRGHKLFVDDWAQIFVDTDVTLTLRNVTVGNGRRSLTYPPIKLASYGSKLCLDNTTIDLGNDFLFPQGQFFIHNDVKFTGTSALVYTSPVPSWIASGGRLYFDHGTTFSVAPATFTDAPYTLKNTYTDCNFIKMVDKNSQLYLNGCSLKTTDTGMRLTKGSICFDNVITTQSISSTKLLSVTLTTSTFPGARARIAVWSPDSKYLAVCGDYSTQDVIIYRWNGLLLSKITTISFGQEALDIAWSPDGKYLAVGGWQSDGSNTLRMYDWNDPFLTLKTGNKDLPTTVHTISWSPDGKYLATGTDGSNQSVFVYSWDGQNLVQKESYNDTYAHERLVWSPDGKYLAIARSDNTITIRSFPNINNIVSSKANIASFGLRLSPELRYILGGTSTTLHVARWDGSNIIPITSDTSIGGQVRFLSWHPSGQYFAVAGTNSSTNYFAIWEWNGSSLTSFSSISGRTTNNSGYGIDWSNDGKYIAVVGDKNSTYQTCVQIFTCNYGSETTPQAFSKSIVFGDSTRGADYDVDVQILSGAQVSVRGKIFDDSALN